MNKNYGIPYKTIPPDLKYCLGFDIKNGLITGLFPTTSSKVPETNIKIDTELAEKFLDGIYKFKDFRIDIKKTKLVSVDHEFNNNDVLFRIPVVPYASTNAECKIVYDNDKLKFSLDSSIEYNTNLSFDFLVTKYNDPTIIFKTKQLSINDIKKGYSFDLDVEDFSIFTSKYFEDYSLEIL